MVHAAKHIPSFFRYLPVFPSISRYSSVFPIVQEKLVFPGPKPIVIKQYWIFCVFFYV